MSQTSGSTDLREQSAGELVSRLSEQVSRLVRDELRLAQVELKEKGKRAGLGAGLSGAAGVLALFGLGALVAASVVALDLVLPAWAAALIIGGALLLIAGVLAAVGVGQVKRGTPPVPEEALASVRQDVEMVRESARR